MGPLFQERQIATSDTFNLINGPSGLKVFLGEGYFLEKAKLYSSGFWKGMISMTFDKISVRKISVESKYKKKSIPSY